MIAFAKKWSNASPPVTETLLQMNLANGLTRATRPHSTLSRVVPCPFSRSLNDLYNRGHFPINRGIIRFAGPSCPCPPLPVHEQGQDWRPPIPAAYLSTPGRPSSPRLSLPGLCGDPRGSAATPCGPAPAPGPGRAFPCAKVNFRENGGPAPPSDFPCTMRA